MSATQPPDPDDVDRVPDFDLDWSVLSGVLEGVSLRQFLRVFLPASTVTMLVGSKVSPGLLTSPRAYIEDVIVDWIYTNLVKPIAESLVTTFGTVADVFLTVAFGADKDPFYDASSLGVLDVVPYGTEIVVGALSSVFVPITTAVENINGQLVTWGETLGFPGLVVLPVMWAAEAALALYAAYYAVTFLTSAVDVPFVKVENGLDYFLTPARTATDAMRRWLFK